MSSSTSSQWRAPSACPPHAAVRIERAVQALPDKYLRPPQTGEVFDSAEACLHRLQGFALSQGFAIVKASGSLSSKRPRIQYKCVHYGQDSRNTHKLETHIQRDAEGAITTRRKRENTQVLKKSCTWSVTLSQRIAGDDESSGVILFLNVTNLIHSHPMASNVLQYKQHEKVLEDYTEAVRVAALHRESFLPYSVSQRILEKEGLNLSRTDYYNLHRNKAIRGVQDEFEALVHALDEAGFRFACRMEERKDENGVILKRKLQQVWFTLDLQIELAQRFIADFVMLVDGTFSTNALNLTLISMIGITNTGHSFPAVQSFARSEAAMSFDFIFECNRDYIFTGKIPPPRVIISDQAGGIISSLPTYLPNAILQFCNWHISQNIKARLLKGKYTKDLREQITAQFWQYCTASTTTQITDQRLELTALLTEEDVEFVLNTWKPKEKQFLRFYTSKYPNLGCYSNQRSESTHVIMKESLNPQLRLSEATTRLDQTIRRKIKEIVNEEAISGNKIPRTLDQRAFIQLIHTVTIYAIDIIAKEWESTKQAVDQGQELPATAESCECEILLRYSLPCRHYLQEIYRNGQPIPRSLVHPRWWVNGPLIQCTGWRPIISTITLPISPVRNQVTHSAQLLMDLRDTLQGETKARVDRLMLQATENVIQLAQQAEKESLLPTEMPDKVKKPGWRKQLKSHDKTKRRSMTLVEALEREERRQPSGQPSEPLIISDDDGFDPPQDPPSPSPSAPPPSTAPLALASTGKKRVRKHTTVYREAFGDSQNDPTAGIKRGKAGGLL